jgi:hypothetical protein
MADTEVKTGTMTGEQLEAILDRMFKANQDDIKKWHDRMMADHEDNFITVDGYVAILDIATIRVDTWDGCNGFYELSAEQYVETMKQFGENLILDDELIMTKQGLVKRYRFPLMINEIAGEDIFQYRIVKIESLPNKNTLGNLASPMQSIEWRMRRAGVDV